MEQHDVRQEIRQKCKKITRKALAVMTTALVGFGSVIGYCWFVLQMQPAPLAAVATTLFQLGLIAYGLGYVFGYFEKTTVRMDIGIDQGLKTSQYLSTLQGDLAPILRDLANAIKDVKTTIEELKTGDIKKVVTSLEDAKAAIIEMKDSLRDKQKVERDLEDSLAQEVLITPQPQGQPKQNGHAGLLDIMACSVCGNTVDSQAHRGFCLGQKIGEGL